MESTKLDTELHIRLTSKLVEKIKAAAKKARRTVPDWLRVTLEDASDATK